MSLDAYATAQACGRLPYCGAPIIPGLRGGVCAYYVDIGLLYFELFNVLRLTICLLNYFANIFLPYEIFM